MWAWDQTRIGATIHDVLNSTDNVQIRDEINKEKCNLTWKIFYK